MKIDHLDGLVAFTTVSRTRSFTAAGAELEVTPQAVSQSIRSLAEKLGVRLFNRTTRSVSLNEAGAALFARVGPALTDVVEALDAVQASREKPAGLLRVNLPRPAFSGLLQPVLAKFHAAYPDIRLELTFDDGFVDIADRGFDAGIRLGESVAKDMVSVALSREERAVIVAAPGYLRTHGVPRSIGELQSHQAIRFRFPLSGGVYRWELLQDGKLVEVEVNGAITVNDTSVLVSSALDGLGLAYVLESVVTQHLSQGRLQRVLDAFCPSFQGFHLYYPSRRQMPAKLRCFIDFWRGQQTQH